MGQNIYLMIKEKEEKIKKEVRKNFSFLNFKKRKIFEIFVTFSLLTIFLDETLNLYLYDIAVEKYNFFHCNLKDINPAIFL